MNLKTLTLVMSLLCFSTVIHAQQLYLEGGKSSTSFKYENSQGTALENLQATSKSYISAGYRTQFLLNKLHLSLGAQYSSYGALASNDPLGNYMSWDADYLETAILFDYTLLSIKKAEFFVKTGTSAGIFLQGAQTLNNSVIDLSDEDDFNTVKLDFKLGTGVIYPVTEGLSVYLQYMYSNGFNQADNNASLKLKSHQIGFGLLLNISKQE